MSSHQINVTQTESNKDRDSAPLDERREINVGDFYPEAREPSPSHGNLSPTSKSSRQGNRSGCNSSVPPNDLRQSQNSFKHQPKSDQIGSNYRPDYGPEQVTNIQVPAGSAQSNRAVRTRNEGEKAVKPKERPPNNETIATSAHIQNAGNNTQSMLLSDREDQIGDQPSKWPGSIENLDSVQTTAINPANQETNQIGDSTNKPLIQPDCSVSETMLKPNDVGSGLVYDRYDEVRNSQMYEMPIQEFTDEQRVKLNNIINIFSSKDNLREKLKKQNQKYKDQARDIMGSQAQMLPDGAPFYYKEFGRKFVIYDQNSLCIFSADGWLRKKIVWLTCWPMFDNFIIIIIFINSLMLGAYDYSDRENESSKNKMIEKGGQFFTYIFTLECIIKITAMGFIVHRNSYLRDLWNWLDFIVVCIGIVENIPVIPSANLKSLRTLRVLRPLRSINAFPSMRRLIGSLLASLPSLGNAVVFMSFILLLFGILGVQQFRGVLYQRCRYNSQPDIDPLTGSWSLWPKVDDDERLCTKDGTGKYVCDAQFYCGSPDEFHLSLESEGVNDQESINYGIVTFDHLGVGMITIFQMITLEGWSDIMYNLSDASQPWMAIAFCVLLVMIGSFFLLNVILAVIMDAFDDVDKNSKQDDAKKEKEKLEQMKLYGIDVTSESDQERIDIKDEKIDSLKKKQESFEEGEIDLVLSNTVPHKNKKNFKIEPINENQIDQVKYKTSDPNEIPMQFKESQNNANLNQSSKMKKPRQIELPERSKNNIIYRLFFRICTHNVFNVSITLCIITNTILLASDRYPIAYQTQQDLEQKNGVLSQIFFWEMIVKLIGLGFKEYAADSFNLFDCTVVMISVIEQVIAMVGVKLEGGGAISALRAVRLLRVFKLARSWTSFRDLLQKMMITLKDIRNFSVLMMIFMFIYTLLGMELYAYKVMFSDDDKTEVVSENGVYPRANFNEFLTGFVTIFIVFIGEDWNSAMYDHYRATGYFAVPFFISLFILGNLILVNLFLAILLKNFEEPPGKDEDDDLGDEPKISIVQKIKNIMCCCCKKKDELPSEEVVGPDGIPVNKSADGKLINNSRDGNTSVMSGALKPKLSRKGTDNNIPVVMEKKRSQGRDIQARLSSEERLQSMERVENPNTDDKRRSSLVKSSNQQISSKTPSGTQKLLMQGSIDGPISNMNHTDVVKHQTRKRLMKKMTSEIFKSDRFTLGQIKKLEVMKSQQPKTKNIELTGTSLFIMSEKNQVRQWCTKIVGYENFDNFILVLIVFSTVLLTLENPLNDPDGTLQVVLEKIDVVVSILFTIELVLKVLVYGFMFNGKDSYMRSGWNIMDFVIVVFSLISMTLNSGLEFIKVLRILRVLRPLRMISRNPGLRIAVQSLINAIPDIGNVMVVSVLFLLLFAIVGTNFYKGAFFYCHYENVPEDLVDRIQDKFDCMDYGGDWVNVDQNFDNVGNSMITLFNVMTTEGWIGVMWNAVDSTQINQVPIENNSQASVFFFIAFMIVGYLFVLNMFVGIVINVFNSEKENLLMNHLLTETQLDWCEVLIYIYNQKPLVKFSSTGNKIKDTCHNIATYWLFEHFIFTCIVFNTFCLCLKWYDEPTELEVYLDIINLIFNVIYTIEAIIKLIAFGIDYFNDGWNVFDFVIVLAAWIGSILNQFEGLDLGASTTVIRSFRISRIFKIIKKYKNLRILFLTFIGAIPQLTNVGALLFLFLFLYSVLGVFLFAQIKIQDAISIHANFQSFGGALLTLFRMSTGESWHELMFDCGRMRSITYECQQEQTYEEILRDHVQGCGSPALALTYFVSFTIIVSFIFLNLFIAIILESFNTSQVEEGLQVGAETLRIFNQFWSAFDPKGKGFIPVLKFGELIDLILEEEIRQIYKNRERVQQGEVELGEIESEIYMFNLHQDELLLAIGGIKKDQISREMYAGEDDENDTNKQANNNQKNLFNAELSDSDGEQNKDSVKKIKKNLNTQGDKNLERDQRKLLRKFMNAFIGTLKIPCYDKVKYYYYYDVLEALSRNLFQNLLIEQREELLENESSSDAGSSQYLESLQDQQSPDRKSDVNISQQIDASMWGTKQIGVGSKKDDKSQNQEPPTKEEVEQEQEDDIRNGDLELILAKLEQKGHRFTIFKYQEMQQRRARRNKKVQDKLSQFGSDKWIIDSSQVVGAMVILKLAPRFLKSVRKRRELQKEQMHQRQKAMREKSGSGGIYDKIQGTMQKNLPISKQQQSNDSQKTQNDSDVQQDPSLTLDGDGQGQVQPRIQAPARQPIPQARKLINQQTVSGTMPQINEADNEDRDEGDAREAIIAQQQSSAGTQREEERKFKRYGELASLKRVRDTGPGNKQGDGATFNSVLPPINRHNNFDVNVNVVDNDLTQSIDFQNQTTSELRNITTNNNVGNELINQDEQRQGDQPDDAVFQRVQISQKIQYQQMNKTSQGFAPKKRNSKSELDQRVADPLRRSLGGKNDENGLI